ncbi:GGDEF domain-containing protein [Vibrio sp. CAU 1672]|uniref:tetratricopeptide repeat-containing diguanylate cyclase n=1 Tax=Vibrio sp. CAU 1672 TaxID=3032594 RepID=UPI0023DB175B|nr:GGDEF domain-containing protein [Vibrio sp. CAU 1672]MDF2154393.1 diguanylate cyclase [Vibrio sp. CAU 1672]
MTKYRLFTLGSLGVILLAMLYVFWQHPVAKPDATTLKSPEIELSNTPLGQRLITLTESKPSEASRVLEQLQAIESSHADDLSALELAYLLWLKRHSYLTLGKSDQADETTHRLEQLIQTHRLNWLDIRLKIDQANVNLKRGHYPQGIETIEHAITLAKQFNAERLLIHAYNVGGILYNATNQLQQSLLYFTQGLKLAQKYPQSQFNAQFYNNLGLLYVHLERWDKAISHLNKARQLFTRMSPVKNNLMHITLLNESFVYIHLNDKLNAQASYRAAQQYLNDNSPAYNQILDLKNAARLLNFLGDTKQGMSKAQACIDHPQAPDYPKQQAICWYISAQSLLALGDHQQALQQLEKSIAIFSALNHPRWLIQAHLLKANALETANRSNEALALYKQYHEKQRNQLLSEFYALEFGLETQQIQQERDLLDTQNKLNALQLKQEQLRFKILLVLGAIGATILVIMLRRTLAIRAQNKQLLALSFQDQLTGMYNRRFYQNEVEAFTQIDRSAGYRIVLLDIDWFKRINDQYGHETGDQVLRQTAGRLSEKLDSDEILVRWGGEEFLCLLKEGPAVPARIDSMLEAISQTPFKTQTGPISASVSIGISRPLPATELHNNTYAFVEADQCLYKAKEAGRNRAIYSDNQ